MTITRFSVCETLDGSVRTTRPIQTTDSAPRTILSRPATREDVAVSLASNRAVKNFADSRKKTQDALLNAVDPGKCHAMGIVCEGSAMIVKLAIDQIKDLITPFTPPNILTAEGTEGIAADMGTVFTGALESLKKAEDDLRAAKAEADKRNMTDANGVRIFNDAYFKRLNEGALIKQTTDAAKEFWAKQATPEGRREIHDTKNQNAITTMQENNSRFWEGK